MLKKLNKNKKGQTGETMTWIVATIIIIIILTVSIIIANYSLKSMKKVNEQFFQTADVLASKSMYSYMLTRDFAGNNVYTQLKNNNSMNDFNGNLAIKIFMGFYSTEYSKVWLGFIDDRQGLQDISAPNSYFGEGTRGVKEKTDSGAQVYERIKINENSSAEMRLYKK